MPKASWAHIDTLIGKHSMAWLVSSMRQMQCWCNPWSVSYDLAVFKIWYWEHQRETDHTSGGAMFSIDWTSWFEQVQHCQLAEFWNRAFEVSITLQRHTYCFLWASWDSWISSYSLIDRQIITSQLTEAFLCRHFQREIAAYDIHTQRMDLYGEGEGYSERAMLLYDGLHYDALAVSGDWYWLIKVPLNTVTTWVVPVMQNVQVLWPCHCLYNCR